MAKLCPEIQCLRKTIGAKAMRSLREGRSTLQVWRRTTPHNVWVENGRRDMLWHVDESRRRPDLRMFELVKHSTEKVVLWSFFGTHKRQGKPEQSWYRLKPEFCLKRGRDD